MPPGDNPLLFRTSRKPRGSQLPKFLGELTQRIVGGRTISCLIADDVEIRRLNRQYRGKRSATDVLSFPVPSRGRGAATGLAGDIAISIDRAREQAAERGHSLADELRILMLHGALHLAGMDHDTDCGEMARAEVRWRKRFGLPHGLIERAQGGLKK